MPLPERHKGLARMYQTTVGELVVANDGTVERFAGDGVMAFQRCGRRSGS
jgi:class 3 adenylate cyclase